MAGIKFEHVDKYFGNVHVLKDVNIDIPDREFLVMVGPSGCGKSTALRCLAGLDEITTGNIYIGNRVVNDVPPKDRDIAMVFQSYALYPHMSVYDNMAFGLKLRKTPKQEIDQRVKESAEMLAIGHLLDRKPKALSGGSGTANAPASTTTAPSPRCSVPSKKFIAGEPMKPATNMLVGRSYNTCGGSSCCRIPSRITAMRVPIVIASVWSCVT
jgi:ABC-type nitrate/sulfonate/bicarbonate transport system ATPase subunit